jgi:hypothetical protein
MEALLASRSVLASFPAGGGGGPDGPTSSPHAPQGPPPPAGPEVTLVVTDVQDGKVMWESHPSAMVEGMLVHDEVLRGTLAAAGGYLVRTEGDSFLVAFHSALMALQWCLDCQTALLAAPWPEELLRLYAAAPSPPLNPVHMGRAWFLA